jgi:hypothetical protein
MSDVPELDELIREYDSVYLVNRRWDRRARFFIGLCRLFLVIGVTGLACMFGVSFGLAVLPFALAAAKRAIADPPFRDPFRRYNYM